MLQIYKLLDEYTPEQILGMLEATKNTWQNRHTTVKIWEYLPADPSEAIIYLSKQTGFPLDECVTLHQSIIGVAAVWHQVFETERWESANLSVTITKRSVALVKESNRYFGVHLIQQETNLNLADAIMLHKSIVGLGNWMKK